MFVGIEDLKRSLVAATVSIAVLATVFVAAGHMSASAAPRPSDDAVATASAQNFEESLRMEITKKDGSNLSAKGSASGTVDGKVSFKIHTVNGSKATASFYGRNSKGTISGTGVAKYSVSGAVTSYTGKIKTLTGTGKYANASSAGISLSGTVNRRTYDVKMTLSGRWSV
ncbi:MAG TPA: hypothetical protein VFT79_11505 [Solirubrobacterales bacterium]|nr:hypothetical protein [Solirubrobacterales bacterium]